MAIAYSLFRDEEPERESDLSKVTQLESVSKDQGPGIHSIDIIAFLLWVRHSGCGPCSPEVHSLVGRQRVSQKSEKGLANFRHRYWRDDVGA